MENCTNELIFSVSQTKLIYHTILRDRPKTIFIKDKLYEWSKNMLYFNYKEKM